MVLKSVDPLGINVLLLVARSLKVPHLLDNNGFPKKVPPQQQPDRCPVCLGNRGTACPRMLHAVLSSEIRLHRLIGWFLQTLKEAMMYFGISHGVPGYSPMGNY
ncbi:hypothetical protein MM239_18490 [Belliella sp. DSM 111904]|uniref:Uncharacterized protein n=1 Tax=Belliella filtrata TaxID=2923435 RepID=A0ABS9V4T4_9BACT|nr:hypothetical protein [Belliella filtrata]MCH7411388.1 hypothetical protein [Belliella filtrata]